MPPPPAAPAASPLQFIPRQEIPVLTWGHLGEGQEAEGMGKAAQHQLTAFPPPGVATAPSPRSQSFQDELARVSQNEKLC